MNLVRKDDDILDTYVVVEKPKGLGFCIGSDDDLDAYEGVFFEKEDRENLIPIFVFNNELPYSIGDTQVCFYNKDSKETIFTNDTNVVVFSDYEVVMLNKSSLNNSQIQLKQNLTMGLL